jgi:hypothetical protein
MEMHDMTITEHLTLATDKVAHWNSKRDHALAMLTKWQGRLSALQSKGKPLPTAKKLPPVTLVPGTEHLMPRGAIKTTGDQAAAEHAARAAALADIAAESDNKVVPITNGKAKPATVAKKKPKKR